MKKQVSGTASSVAFTPLQVISNLLAYTRHSIALMTVSDIMNETWGGSTTVKKQVSGTASSVAFTPLQVISNYYHTPGTVLL